MSSFLPVFLSSSLQAHQPTCQPPTQLVSLNVFHPTSQSTYLPANQTIKQPVCYPFLWLAIVFAENLTNKLVYHSVSRPTSLVTSLPASLQPSNQLVVPKSACVLSVSQVPACQPACPYVHLLFSQSAIMSVCQTESQQAKHLICLLAIHPSIIYMSINESIKPASQPVSILACLSVSQPAGKQAYLFDCQSVSQPAN